MNERGFEERQGCPSVAQSRKLIRPCGSMIFHYKHIHIDSLTLSTVVPNTEITKLGKKKTDLALFCVRDCFTSNVKPMQKGLMELATPHSSLGSSGGGCCMLGKAVSGWGSRG